jgi:probable rRNA maturation factor
VRRLVARRRSSSRRAPKLAPPPRPPPLELADRQSFVELGRRRVARAVAAARALASRRRGALSVALVDDATIRALHRDHLDDDTPTDVLSFPLDRTPGWLGEVVASGETARREALARGVAPRDELLLYVVHGLLHLLGFDDHAPADRKKMRAAERAALRAVGVRRDLFPSPHDR